MFRSIALHEFLDSQLLLLLFANKSGRAALTYCQPGIYNIYTSIHVKSVVDEEALMEPDAALHSAPHRQMYIAAILAFLISVTNCPAATLTISPRPTEGTVTTDAGAINCGTGGSRCSAAITAGTSVTLTATPESSRYSFESWHVGQAISTENPYTNVMPPIDITGYVTFTDHRVNGVCGSDNGTAVSSTPVNLCSSGTPTAVSGSGPWEWSCLGQYTGSDAECRAELLTFSPFALQTWPKRNHTTTLLHNGRLLVTGGSTTTGPTATADIYDPGTNSWSSAGNLAAVRSSHTATMLPNGKVLVAGGWGSSSRVATAEIYDPVANSWTAVPGMSTPRSNHTATLLADGRVLVAGGTDGANDLMSAEIYTYTTNSWSPAGSMAAAHAYHTATLLPGGSVLVAGGLFVTAAELYNPGTNSWSSAGDMTSAHALHSATLLPNGRVLVAGGQGGLNAPVATTELYNPQTNSWAAGGNLITPLSNHTASLLPNGTVLVTGGTYDNSGYKLAAAALYDPDSNSWGAAGNMASARIQHTATVMPDGSVAIVGGGGNGSWPAQNERYYPAAGSWSSTGSLSRARQTHTATLLPDGTVLVTGGYNGGYLATAERYDPATGSWPATGELAAPRQHHTATLLTNGTVLVTGGYTGSYLATAELYDPATGSWSPAQPPSHARAYHSATLLRDGTVLIAGGYNSDGYLAAAEIYNPATNSWSSAGTLTKARRWHTATLLPNGKVLIAAGDWAGPNASAELYDPATNSWASAGSLANSRYDHRATLLPSGKVLITGGYGGTYLASAELYDPAGNSWAPAQNMGTARKDHTATLLPGGKVLVAGGYGDGYLSSVESYDPATNSWTPEAGLTTTAALSQRATLLLDGRVLVTAGFNYGSDLSPAILYDPGPGFAENRRPLVTSTAFDYLQPNMLVIKGSGLRGDSEATSGGSAGSSSGYPLMHLQRIDNDQCVYLNANTDRAWSDTVMYSAPVSGLPAGHYRASAIVNGIPGIARIVALRGYNVSFVSGNSNAGMIFGTTPQYLFPGVPSSAVQVNEIYPYKFLNWSGTNGFVSTSDNPLVISNLSADMIITANFTSTDVEGACGATHNSYTHTKPASNLCTVGSASAVGGSGPWNWSCGSFVPASCFTTAQPMLTLSLSGSGSGNVTITSVQGTVPCPAGTCQQLFPHSTAVSLLATPGSISVFSGWNGACSDPSGTCNLDMNGDLPVNATFNLADKARIASAGFASLALAYQSVASTSATTIMALDADLGETLNLNQAWNILLWGGWKADYSSTSGQPTLLRKLTVSNGSLRVKGGVAIRYVPD